MSEWHTLTIPTWTSTDASAVNKQVIEMPPNGIVNLQMSVSGISDTGVALAIQGSRCIKRGTGAPILVGLPALGFDQRDLGAATWGVTLGTSGDFVIVTTTGAAGATIMWGARAEWLDITF